MKEVFLTISEISQGKTVLEPLLKNVYQKEAPTQVFSCEISEILRTPVLKTICERLVLILQKELLNSSKILYFN